jgi:two-component system, NtrC family, response regulator AtoC
MIESSIKTARVLVVSRDAPVLDAVWSVAGANCWQTEVAGDVWDALEKGCSQLELDLVVLDLSNDPENCVQVSRILSRIRPKLPLILISKPGDLDRSQGTARVGASNYLSYPLQLHELEAALQKNLSTSLDSLGQEIGSDDVEFVGDEGFFIGISPVMRVLRARIARLAETDAPVLLTGEAGSGRETIARLLHRLSIRSGFDFVRVNCAALPEELLEWKIFGYEALEGTASANADLGKHGSCDRGTIFLDEITEIPLRLQEKLVKLIRDQRLARAAATNPLDMHARLVGACTVSVDQAVAERRLLVDLAREFSGYQVRVPALRERREEISFLSRHFMHQLARRYSLPARDIAPSVCAAWQEHDWPGNLRELEESVKRYMVAGERDASPARSPSKQKEETDPLRSIQPQKGHHKPATPSQAPWDAQSPKSLRSLLRSVKEEAERNAIARALEETGWNRKAAARLLRTSYRTVLYKIEQYRMSASDSARLSNGRSAGSRNTESRGAGQEEGRLGSASPGA